jgi:murein L,D-transpeptidase YcbB/YkuD
MSSPPKLSDPTATRLRRGVLACVLAAASLARIGAQTPAATAPPPPAAQPVALTKADASVLISMLQGAEDKGLSSKAFNVGDAPARLDSTDPGVRAGAEQKLETAAIAYARAEHGGSIQGFPTDWAIRPAPYDAQADFTAALEQHRLAAWAAGLSPTDQRYVQLVQAYGRYRQIADNGGWRELPDAALREGSKGGQVVALRKRLAIEDPAVTAGGAVYDAALAEAVSRAQTRYGMDPDGALDSSMIEALNVPVSQRVAQIRANLERWRWLPTSLPASRIELNIADQRLELYEDGQPTLGMKAIVGRPKKPTPMISDAIETIVLNPPWYVPPDIQHEIYSKGRGYLRSAGFVSRGGRLMQRPGKRCALGSIKFDLSNSFGVYLHDTPDRNLFAKEDRALSHGCMRLEQPNALAKLLLKDDPDWSEDRLDAAIATGATQHVHLASPMPVFVVYWSAFIDDQGQIHFRPDVYGWDEKLIAML